MMRVKTLKATTDRLGGLLAYYAGLVEDRADPSRPGRGPVDYYLDPDEPAGRWCGSGRHALGLSGPVAAAELGALLEARHPTSGKKLGRGFGDTSARGFDATFSAPKSVSVLWALTPDSWVRAEVLAAHDAAVDAALGWFEAHGALTRRGTNGIHQVDTEGVAVAVFRQHTSRAMDPQLHTHAVISAKVQDGTGKWLSLDARFLKYQQRTIGWVYDAALRAELTARLGVAWEPAVDGPSDMVCVPEAAREAFSHRTAQVEAKLAELVGRWSTEHDGTEPDIATIARLERAAVVASRPAKAHGIDAAELHRLWAHQARTVAGIDPDTLTADRLARPDTLPSIDEPEIVAEAIRLVSEESSTWIRADLARHITTLLPPDATHTAQKTTGLIDRLAAVAELDCVSLSPQRGDGPRRRDGGLVDDHVTDRQLTTRAVLDQEKSLQFWAGSRSYPTGPGTGDPQADATEAMAGPAGMVIVVGPAGTGKTRATADAVRLLQARDRQVVGLAPSGKAADVLGVEANCPTDTLAGFLARHRDPRSSPWKAGTTIILDEASMASTDDLARLVALAQKKNWRIVAVGDPAQLPAVGRGGMFAHWCETVPHHRLETPRRFEHDWEAQASLQLRAGDPQVAEIYADRGRLHTSHPALLTRQLTRLHARHTAEGATVAITTNTTATAATINQAIQAQTRRRRGELRADLKDHISVYVGDQIATRRNDPTLTTTEGEPVRNRHTWTVEAVGHDGSLVVSHPQRGEVDLPADYVASHVELGWAVTGYGNQGDTVDIGIAVLEPGTTRNHAYVAMTRGRHSNHAWIPDPTGTTDAAAALTDIIGRTPTHHSALATYQQLHEQAGLTPPEPAAIDREPPGIALGI